MTSLRPFFYLLLAANIVLATLAALPWLGIQLPWAPTGEADRLGRQLVPEKIQVLASRPASEPQPDTPEVPIEEAPPTTPETLCALVSGLNAANAQLLADQATRLGDRLSVKLSGIVPTSYWVNIAPNGGKEGAAKRSEVLTNAGVADHLIVREAGPHQFAISLGLYRNEEAAKRLIEQLRKKEIITARITVRDNTGNNARAKVSGPPDDVNALLQDFLSSHKDAQRDVCVTP